MEPLASTARAAYIERLTQEQFDVLVIGGGITGAGVLPLTMVDNSDLSPFRLTASSDSPYDKETIPAIHFKQRGFVWPFMCSCFYSWFAFSSLWHFCGVLAGSPFNLPTQQLHPGAAQSTVCSSHAPHLTAFPVVSALRLRRVED